MLPGPFGLKSVVLLNGKNTETHLQSLLRERIVEANFFIINFFVSLKIE